MSLAWVRSTDLAPRFSRRVRAAVRHPLGVLGLTVGVASLCGLVIHPRVFALAGGLALVAGLGVWWPWLTVRGVRGRVGFDLDRVTEGESVAATVSVVNPLPWPAWGLAVRGGYGDAPVRLGAVPGRSRSASRWAFATPHRGEFPLAVPRLATAFPFGLWTSSRPAEVGNRLLVWPRTVAVGPLPTSDGEAAAEGAVARSRIGATGDVVGVRPYRRGDSPRRVHWAQSAKHDRLVVCELEAATRPVVVLVLDADPAVHTPGPDGTREWAIRVVASFAKGWLTAGVPVGVAWVRTVYPPTAGGGQILRVLDGLARVPGTAPPLAEVLAHPALRAHRGAIRVVVTSDAGVRVGRAHDGFRWVVLERAGFPGAEPIRDDGCEEAASRRAVKPWVTIPAPGAVADRLRHGWAEARHGS